jgi:hypothetical protein
MIETLYRTETPEKGVSECYMLVLTSRATSGRKVFLFMEEHGYWDERSEQFLHKISSIDTENEMTYEDAFALYVAAKEKLAQRGFIHSVIQDYKRKEPRNHRAIVPELPELEAIVRG